jgi:DNA polymerase III subunit epsilon
MTHGKDSTNFPALLPRLRARLEAASRPVPLATLGRELFFASHASPEMLHRLLAPLLKQLPEARLLADDSVGWMVAESPFVVGESQPLKGTRFVVIDLETTGGSATEARVTEIALYAIENERIVGEFSSLINPRTVIPDFIVRLTGITNEMVASAPPFPDVAEAVRAFIGDGVLVAHNVGFDAGFLAMELNRQEVGATLANKTLCTVRLARHLAPGLDNYRLHTVADHFGIEIVNRHRAGGDALATAKIFLKMLDVLDELGVRTVSAARHLGKTLKRRGIQVNPVAAASPERESRVSNPQTPNADG